MKMSKELIAEIKRVVEEMDLTREYGYVGVRVQSRAFTLGPIDHLSHVWDNGDDTGEELDGICACMIRRLGANHYFGDHAAIICGNSAEYGEDDGELIIRDPEVAYIIC